MLKYHSSMPQLPRDLTQRDQMSPWQKAKDWTGSPLLPAYEVPHPLKHFEFPGEGEVFPHYSHQHKAAILSLPAERSTQILALLH